MYWPLARLLNTIVTHGSLIVVDAAGTAHSFGDRTGQGVAIRITDRATERRLAFDPELEAGEAYMHGRLVLDQGTFYDFLSLILRNIHDDQMPGVARTLDSARALVRRLQQFNPRSRARRNVVRHYDIDPRIYDLFLDADRQYSCAVFAPGVSDLDAAQREKKRRIAAKLALEPGMRVLDIGAGWGGLVLTLAKAYGCQATGITLSDAQLRIARLRAHEAGRDDDVAFELSDYRTVMGRFDRIVSIGMFEHVGAAHYGTFFHHVSDLLEDDGAALVHTIGRSGPPAPTNPFIARHIFPGGALPSLSEIMRAIEPTCLIVTDVEVLRLHYAETLSHWRRRFMARRAEAVAIAGETFVRMWEAYLSGSEAAFRYQNLVVFQIQLAKQLETLPTTREYMQPSAEARASLNDERPTPYGL